MPLTRLVWIPLMAMAAFAQGVTLTSYPNPSSFGQYVTLTAVVGSGATGRVTFYDDVTVLGTGVVSSGQAILRAPLLLPGLHPLLARYDGDATHAAAVSTAVAQTVNPSTALGFGAPASLNTAGLYVATGDFNGDGITDLAIANASTVSVALGNGDGTFRSPVGITVATTNPSGLVAGDFNGDGIPDLAVGGTVVSILLGKGDGTFQNGAAPAISGASGILSADFNFDGITDLALASGAAVVVALGNGDGTFQQKATYTLPGNILTMALGDFNSDAKADLAVFTFSPSSLYLLLGNGDGTLQSPVTTSTASEPEADYVATADFNGDGRLDIVTAGGGPSVGGAAVYLGNGDGTFQPAVVVSNGPAGTSYGGVAAADLNGDGNPDVIYFSTTGTTRSFNSNVLTLINNGDGTFQQTSVSAPVPAGILTLIAGNFNGDGVPDVAVTTNFPAGVYTLLGAVADLGIAIGSSGTFVSGQNATIDYTVSNGTGATASGGAVTITPALPSTLMQTSLSGTGWTCGTSSCTRSDALAPGASFPPVVQNVTVATTSATSFTVQAGVSGGGSPAANATDVISESVLPGTPVLTSPANGAVLNSTQVQLAWTAGSNATSQDLYLGNATPPPLLIAKISASPFSPSSLQAGTTYYWQIVDRNSSGATPSAIWSFTIACSASVSTGNIELGPAAQNATLAVSDPAGCPWSATSDVPWITITSGSGMGTQLSYSVAANTGLPRIGTITVGGTSATITQDAEGLGFVSVTPCRVVDTRNANGAFGGPTMTAGQTRTFNIPAGACGIPASAQAFALNITVVPQNTLNYLTVWPSSQAQPVVSTLNSSNGAVVANAAIVPAASGSIDVYVTDATDVIIDINGYFAPATATGALAFYPVTPCRVADTRNATGTFGGPSLTAGQTRNFPVASSACGIPAAAQAYSLNMTVVPPGPLTYLTVWPAGVSQPYVSTLNAYQGQVVANAAIVPAGTGLNAGAISVYVSDASNVVIDINGYFAPPGQTGALYYYPVTPCRLVDTRTATGPLGGPSLAAGATRSFGLETGACALSARTQAYSLNMTVVPPGPLGYLTAWAAGAAQPYVSTLNSYLGTVVANAAIVPAGTPSGAISVFVSDATNLVIDVNGYFAQ